MKSLAIGDRIPTVNFRTRTDDNWVDISTDAIFAGRTVVVFSLPGAFTPTCSGSQLPGYERLAPLFRANGVDDIVCISVNDGFVMHEWQRTAGIEHVRLLPDGNGEFTSGMGLLVNKGDLGFGLRSRRYSMIVRDGVIERLFIEADVPGDPYAVSNPETMLKAINPLVAIPANVVVLTKPGCHHCSRAKSALRSSGLKFDEFSVPDAYTLHGLSGRHTTPQVFIDGVHIGGADELERHLAGTASQAA